MKIWHISDTHGMHDQLSIPEGIDMVICTGDFTHYPLFEINGIETFDFIKWFRELPIKHKILIPGNHDMLIGNWWEGDRCEMLKHNLPFTLLIHETIEIEGIKIFGSPFVPEYNDWAFMKTRHDLWDTWKDIPLDTDIIATHGPPRGVLDLWADRNGFIGNHGDDALLSKVQEVIPKYHLFGHIHNNGSCYNQGQKQITGLYTTFINSACVTDGAEFYRGLTSNGTVFEI